MNDKLKEATLAVDEINNRFDDIIIKLNNGHENIDWLSLKPYFSIKNCGDNFSINLTISIFNDNKIIKTVYNSKNENRYFSNIVNYYQPFKEYLIDDVIGKDRDLYFKFDYYFDDIKFVNIKNLQKLYQKDITKYIKFTYKENNY